MAIILDGTAGITVSGNSTLGDATTDTLNVANGNLILDASGNMGLGVSPSSWGSSFKSIDVNAYTSFYGTTNNAYSGFSQNAYYNGTNWIYRNTNSASNYIQSGGTHVWQIAASGTAGNSITFTQAMTLDASGNLMVGATSNGGGKLEVKQSANNEAGIWTYSSSTDSNGRFYCDNSVVGIAASYSSTGSYLPIVFKTSNTERARIDSSGNLGLGVTPTSGWSNYRALQIGQFGLLAYNSGTPSTEIGQNYYYNGTNYIAVTSGTAARFVVNNGNDKGFAWYSASATGGNAITFTQAMTLDASGNLSIGTTSTGGGVLTIGGGIGPSSDNVSSCGKSTNRWSVIYAGTGTINTSDAREKTAVRSLTASEITAAQQLANELGAYKWLSAVAEKGDLAREHIGMTVQRAIEIMEANGLTPFNYGFICYDENEETSRYSFRMDELTMFIARGQQAEINSLKARLDAANL